MAQSLLELIFKTSKQGQGGKQAAAELKSLKDTVGEVSGGLGIMNIGALSAVGAISAVGAFVGSATNDWSDYAEEMAKASEQSGITVEDMSRLTQAADDMRVNVDGMQKAFGIALKNGFQPTIENLANLADELQGIQDPTERATKLNKIFGRSWQDVYPLLKDGGQAIRDGTAAIADNMVVTDEAVKANRDYIKAVDDLSDAWTGVKNNVGREVIPVLADLLTAVNDQAAAAAEADKVVGMSREERIKYIEAEKARIQTERDMTDALDWGKQAQEDFNAQMDVGAGFASTLDESLSDTAGTINEDLIPSLDIVKSSFKDLTAEMIFNEAAQGLSADGALELARQLGLVNETTLYAQESIGDLTQQYKDGKITEEEYIQRLTLIRDTISGIESKDVVVKVDTYYKNHFDDTGKNTNNQQTDYQDYIGKANGGWVKVPEGFPNDSFRLPLSSGETAYVMNDRMRWTGQGAAPGGPSLTIGQVVINNEMDYRTFIARAKSDLGIK